MTALKKVFIVIAGVIVLATVLGFMLPADYRVERSIVIDAPPQDIYPAVVNLKQWPQWGVWFKRDPKMEIVYGGPDRAIGMKTEWLSETQGNGQMEITALEHNRKVTYSLYFPEFDMGSVGEFQLIETEQGTRVVWSDSGEVGMNPMDRYFALMMDSFIGPDFEAGLENLKVIVESKS